jgi:hypothetical protein
MTNEGMPLAPSLGANGTDSALRVTFSYVGTDLSVEGLARVEMIAPPAETERIGPERSGAWIELRDHGGEVLYQRGFHDPLRSGVEVPDEPGTGRMRWQRTGRRAGWFEVLVPDLAEAETLVLFSSSPAETGEPAREVARVNVRQTTPSPDGAP